MLRGRCHDCALPISIRYPAVEALTAALWGVLFVAMIPDPTAVVEPARLGAWLLYSVYFSALLAACLIDADHFILPDAIVLPLIPLGWIVVAILDAQGVSTLSFPSAVLGAVAGTAALLAIAFLGRLAFGREAMGLGDVKLVAAIGAWQGLHPTLLLTIFGASMLGSILGIGTMLLRGRERPSKLPFGPYLAGAALISWIAGGRIIDVFLPSFS
jgi:leader peptidase (prepilin peptidase)/N-methyltransferase